MSKKIIFILLKYLHILVSVQTAYEEPCIKCSRFLTERNFFLSKFIKKSKMSCIYIIYNSKSVKIFFLSFIENPNINIK